MISEISLLPPESVRAEILVLPLGGTEFTSTLEVIDKVAPEVVISPADSFKRNGLPSNEWHELLAEKGITLLRQDETGAVIINANPKSPSVIPFLTPEKKISLGEETGEGLPQRH